FGDCLRIGCGLVAFSAGKHFERGASGLCDVYVPDPAVSLLVFISSTIFADVLFFEPCHLGALRRRTLCRTDVSEPSHHGASKQNHFSENHSSPDPPALLVAGHLVWLYWNARNASPYFGQCKVESLGDPENSSFACRACHLFYVSARARCRHVGVFTDHGKIAAAVIPIHLGVVLPVFLWSVPGQPAILHSPAAFSSAVCPGFAEKRLPESGSLRQVAGSLNVGSCRVLVSRLPVHHTVFLQPDSWKRTRQYVRSLQAGRALDPGP